MENYMIGSWMIYQDSARLPHTQTNRDLAVLEGFHSAALST